MKNFFPAHDFKKLATHKKLDNFVVRFTNASQSVEFAFKERGSDIETVSTLQMKTDFDLGVRGAKVILYADAQDSSFQFFANALKPTDEIFFYVREGGSTLTKEMGLVVHELRARITGRKRDGKLAYVREVTVRSDIALKSSHQDVTLTKIA